MIKKFKLYEQVDWDNDPFGEDFIPKMEWTIVKLKVMDGPLYILEKNELEKIILFPNYDYSTWPYVIDYYPQYNEDSLIWICDTEERMTLGLNRKYKYKDLPKEIKNKLK